MVELKIKKDDEEITLMDKEDIQDKLDEKSNNGHNHDGTYIKTGTGTVTSTNIADGAVTNAKIGDNQVNKYKLSNNSVSNEKIVDGAVTNEKITSINDDKIILNSSSNSVLYPIDMSMVDVANANRLAFMPVENIIVEVSTNGGSTFSTYPSITDEMKLRLVSRAPDETNNLYSGGTTSESPNNQIRVTLDAGAISNSNSSMFCGSVKKLMIAFTTNGASGTKVKVEIASYATPNNWQNVGTYNISGWWGWNAIPLNNISFGGYLNHGSTTDHYRFIRLTFTHTGGTANPILKAIRLYSEKAYISPSNFAKCGHIYTYDNNQNVTFPAKIVKEGGTSSEFLKADGSVDTNVSPKFDYNVIKGTDNTVGYIKALELKITSNYQDKPIVIETYQKDRTQKNLITIKFNNLSSTDPGLTSINYTGDNKARFWLNKESTSTWSLISNKGHADKYGEMSIKINNPNLGITITKLDTHITTLPSGVTKAIYMGNYESVYAVSNGSPTNPFYRLFNIWQPSGSSKSSKIIFKINSITSSRYAKVALHMRRSSDTSSYVEMNVVEAVNFDLSKILICLKHTSTAGYLDVFYNLTSTMDYFYVTLEDDRMREGTLTQYNPIQNSTETYTSTTNAGTTLYGSDYTNTYNLSNVNTVPATVTYTDGSTGTINFVTR